MPVGIGLNGTGEKSELGYKLISVCLRYLNPQWNILLGFLRTFYNLDLLVILIDNDVQGRYQK